MGPIDRRLVLISEWELWACANQVLSAHGEDASVFVAQRIADLQTSGNDAGVRTWRLIGERLTQLTHIPTPAQPLQ